MSARGDEDLSKRTFWERLKESFYKERFEKCKKKLKYSQHKIYFTLLHRTNTLAVYFLEDCVSSRKLDFLDLIGTLSNSTAGEFLSVLLSCWFVSLKLFGKIGIGLISLQDVGKLIRVDKVLLIGRGRMEEGESRRIGNSKGTRGMSIKGRK